MKYIVFSFFLAFMLLAGCPTWPQDTIRIESIGLVPGSRVNAVPYINEALEKVTSSTGTVLLFEKGRYDFWPDHAVEKDYYEANTTVVNPRVCPIFIFKKHNLVIDGAGADFVFHGKMQPFTIDSSANISVKNVSIDWEIPFGAEVEIGEVATDYFDMLIDTRQYPYVIENEKLFFVGEGWKNMWGGVKWNDPMMFERESLMVTPQTDDDLLGENWESSYRAKEIQAGVVRIFGTGNGHLKKGNYLNLRHGVRDHSGVFTVDSKDILFENIRMYNNSGMNFLSQYTENIKYRNVHCIPNPSKRKVLAGHDDGLHHTNCRGSISIDSCSFRGIMDDAVNVHNTYVVVSEILSDTRLRCKFMHHQSIGFIWGRKLEKVSFIQSSSMQTIDTGVIKAFTSLSPELFDIEFNDKFHRALKAGDVLENLTWNPSVEIKNCYFGQHRARAILVSTPGQIRILNNLFESSGSAICIPGDANHWYEGGAVSDVVISNNVFRNCNTSNYQFSEGIISIQPGIPKLNLALSTFHKNIRIIQNTFEVYDAPVLYAFSVDGIEFNENSIVQSYKFVPRYSEKPMLTFDACKNISIKKNSFTGDVPWKSILFSRVNRQEIVLDKKQGFVVRK